MSSIAKLVLKSGEQFSGEALFPFSKPVLGEVVFNTGMVGYIESLTDPSYAGQILVFTYPLIGNYGVSPEETWESDRIQVRGVIVSELAPFYTHHNAFSSLKSILEKANIPCLTGVDTRFLTESLRDQGVVQGALVPDHESVSEFETFDAINWVERVSIKKPETYGKGKYTIIVVDCGIKQNILRCLERFPVRIKRVPWNYDYSQEEYDGVFLSNGPGDPEQCIEAVNVLQRAMQRKKPIFGICLGTQLMALAAGAKTYKLRFGHRSHNQPCLYLPTEKAYLTSQNHGYAVQEDTLTQDWHVTFRNLNDESVAGIAHKTDPFFSVQFHPEASPGPHDTQWLFEDFYRLIEHHV